MNALMEQHTRWAGARDRLWRARPPVVKLAVYEYPKLPPVRWGAPVTLTGLGGYRVILTLVALKHKLRVDDLVGPDRSTPIVTARHEAVRLIWTHCRVASLTALARIFRRDHTTILHSLRKQGIIGKRARTAPRMVEAVLN